jgi:hypothetical protein
MYLRERQRGELAGRAPFGYFGEAAQPSRSGGTACPTRFTRATSFAALIALVRAAETRLAACGFATAAERVHVLRGLYYGTDWSMDFQVERSPVRNAAFQIYTASTTPADPRPCLNCGLFEALRASAEVRDGARSLDFGHLMIGLDARRSAIARSVTLPAQGGTGLAISTWLGDLGGGAAMLAARRVSAPATRAVTVFRGSDFGGSINLEGDAAAFVVARDPAVTTQPAPLQLGPGRTLADALTDYLGPASLTPAWQTRCHVFLSMLGARFDAAGNLINRAALVAALADQIASFGCWYLINRLRQQRRLTPALLRAAAGYLPGAAGEVAEVFVTALEHSRRRPADPIAARGTGPAPTPPVAPTGACAAAIRAATLAQDAAQSAEPWLRRGEQLLDQGRDFWRRNNPF